MKKIWIVLALVLLAGCAPATVAPPTEPITPSPPPSPTETAVPPLVLLPKGNLPDAPYTPLAAPVRFYEETVLNLLPSAAYGRIFPYIGKGKDTNWDGYLCKYGLCTETGVIVCDPAYDAYTVYGNEDNGMYALMRHPAAAIGFGTGAWETTLAAFDGSWVFDLQDMTYYECQYGVTVSVDGLWGVWGYDGQWLLPPTYEGPLHFACGLAPVVSADRETYSYIDITGQPVLGPYRVDDAVSPNRYEKVVSDDGKTYHLVSFYMAWEVLLGPYDINCSPWDIMLDDFLSDHSFSNYDYERTPCYFAVYYEDGNMRYLSPTGNITDKKIHYLCFDPEIFWYPVARTTDQTWWHDVVLSINGAETTYVTSRDAQYIPDDGGRIIIEHFSEGGNTVLDISGNVLFSIPSDELSYGYGYYFTYSNRSDTQASIVYDINFHELFRMEDTEVISIENLGQWMICGTGAQHLHEYKYGILNERGEVLLPAVYSELTVVHGMVIALRGTRSYLFDANLNCVLELDITDGG